MHVRLGLASSKPPIRARVSARAQTIQTPEKANAVFLAGYGFAMRDDDPDFPPVLMGGYLLGGGFLNSRLATRIRQKEGLSYVVGGGFFASPLDQNGRFRASMIYNPKNVVKLETAFREEIERAAKDGFTVEELESVPRLLENDHGQGGRFQRGSEAVGERVISF